MLALSKEELLTKIDEKKIELNKIAAQNGINSGQTIKCSQELDDLILVYQKYFSLPGFSPTNINCWQMGVLAFLYPFILCM